MYVIRYEEKKNFSRLLFLHVNILSRPSILFLPSLSFFFSSGLISSRPPFCFLFFKYVSPFLFGFFSSEGEEEGEREEERKNGRDTEGGRKEREKEK